ncbi:MAG TPA: sortase [Candidatus Limnocylindria bacterium]|nr:sortase [Candidatus Limnocylindria bacterium]
MRLRLTTVLALALIAIGVWVMVGGGPLVAVQPTAPPTPSGFATSRPPTTEVATATPGPRAIPDGYRVQVPRLRIDLPIKEGDLARDIDDQQTPEHAAFHLPRTAIPGEGSNSYIYAHARTGMFLSLWDAKEGDEVIIVAPGGKTLVYVVREVHTRVPYNETSWVLPTPTERLTLQTSTGPNPQDPRFVVVALPKT